MDAEKQSEDDKSFDNLINIVLWILAIAALFLVVELIWASDWEQRGLIGDWVGGHIAAAAAFATALLLIKQVALQRNHFIMQREELALTREELQRSREVHEAQKEQLLRQADIAEKAAISSHILEIAELRKPWLEAWCKAHENDTMLNINRRGTLQDEMTACDRYIYKLLESSLFNDSERHHYEEMLWLFSKEIAEQSKRGDDDIDEDFIHFAVRHKIKTRAYVSELLKGSD